MNGWLVIPGWSSYQHYSDRRPTWIKLYTQLLHDPDYLALSGHRRGLLHGLWLEYATSAGRIPDNTSTITRRLGMKTFRADLEALKEAGWVEVSASKPLALARAREETEKEKDLPKKVSKPKPARITGWRVVRGTHGMTTVADPNGTDPAPTIGKAMP